MEELGSLEAAPRTRANDSDTRNDASNLPSIQHPGLYGTAGPDEAGTGGRRRSIGWLSSWKQTRITRRRGRNELNSGLRFVRRFASSFLFRNATFPTEPLPFRVKEVS